MIDKYNIENLEESRGEKRKDGFKIRKDNTIRSLKEVESFLWNCKQVFKGIGAYKLIKK